MEITIYKSREIVTSFSGNVSFTYYSYIEDGMPKKWQMGATYKNVTQLKKELTKKGYTAINVVDRGVQTRKAQL